MAVSSSSWSQIEVTGLVQRTHVQDGFESVESAVSRLLDLTGLAVRAVATDGHGGRVVHVVTADLAASACPSRGELSTSAKGRVTTRARDIPYGPHRVRLIWHKRRWRCVHRRCPRGSFTEAVSAAPSRTRLTVRLRAELAAAVADQHRCVAEAAAFYGVGWATVHNAFKARVDPPLAASLAPVTVLGIDETRRGKPVWTQDVGTGGWVLAHDRWHTGFVDSAGTGGLLAQVEGRSAGVVSTWLLAQPAPWRAAITHVTIDLSASFAKGVRDGLPNATLVADRFHVVALGNQTVTAVRQRVAGEHEGRRGRKVDPAWRVRRRLLTGHEHLRPETFVAMWNALIDTSDPGVEILGAYIVKEDLRALLALAGTHPDHHEIAAALTTFYDHAAASTAPEVHRLAATVERWWPAILASLETGYSNSRSEGYNRLAKHEGRNAFGFKNPTNQRRRIRCVACTRQTAGKQPRKPTRPVKNEEPANFDIVALVTAWAPRLGIFVEHRDDEGTLTNSTSSGESGCRSTTESALKKPTTRTTCIAPRIQKRQKRTSGSTHSSPGSSLRNHRSTTVLTSQAGHPSKDSYSRTSRTPRIRFKSSCRAPLTSQHSVRNCGTHTPQISE